MTDRPPYSRRPFANVVAAVATPFQVDLGIDMARLLAHCRWLLSQGCDGLVLFGSTGEAPSLTLGERHAVLDYLLAHGVPPARLLIGSGACALEDTISLTRAAVDGGCAGALVVPPFFFKGLSDLGVIAYYEQLIAAFPGRDLRLYLYHYPQASGVPLGPDLVGALVERFPQVIKGYKDSSGDFANTEAVIRQFPTLEVFTSNEGRLADALRLGGAGCISATANVQPRAIRAILDHFGRPGEGEAQRVAAACRNAFNGTPLVAAVKAALARIHDDPVWCRMRAPLTPFDIGSDGPILTACGL